MFHAKDDGYILVRIRVLSCKSLLWSENSTSPIPQMTNPHSGGSRIFHGGGEGEGADS